MAEKKRLDILLTERGLCESREKAKRLIMSGVVFVDNQKQDKAGQIFKEDSVVEVRGEVLPFVSRGGFKLKKAIESFNISLEGKECMDIGASTGGFTDCMLQNGAKKVYAVDVGYGQLAWKLRTDERVINIERTNFRYFENEDVRELDFCSADVSFISLKLLMPKIHSLLKEEGECVLLIKPQFEAGRDKVGKNGVVRDALVHEQVIKDIIDKALELGFCILGLDFSPIKGPKGNIEYLIYLKKTGIYTKNIPDIKKTINAAHFGLAEVQE